MINKRQLSIFANNLTLSMHSKKYIFGFMALLLFADQLLKIYIKTHFYLGEIHNVLGNWFKLCLVENEGMAFGWTLGNGAIAKVILTVFRIVIIAYFFRIFLRYLRASVSKPFLYAFTLLLSGALGNLLDSIFYGLLFSESMPDTVAQIFTNHYGGIFFGKVVDMFYFPLFRGHFYSWIPVIGGSEFEFFSPVFNLADAYISVGISIIILLILLDRRKYLPKSK